MKTFVLGLVARLVLTLVYGMTWVISGVARMFRRRSSTRRIIINGTFHNPNWFFAHVSPIAASGYGEVILVCDEPIADLPNLTYVCPPAWAGRIFSRALVKFLYTFWIGLRNPADVFVGYHIFPSAITALVCARLLGAKAVYQVAGGELEIEGGGFGAENKVLVALGKPSRWIEFLAQKVTNQFDLVIVRGSRAERYVRKYGYKDMLETVTGSVLVDDALMASERDIDVLFVGRLTEYKRPDRFLEVIHKTVSQVPDIRVSIAGDGPDMQALKKQAQSLGIQDNVAFLGQRSDVPELMGRAKLYALTSRWEGVSIAMLEAMAVKTVPVVSDVGDLRDFAIDGETGFVFGEEDLDAYAETIVRLLNDEALRLTIGEAAHQLILERSEREGLSRRWCQIFERLVSRPDATS